MVTVLTRIARWHQRQEWANGWIESKQAPDLTFEDLRKFQQLAIALCERGKRIKRELDESGNV
jgi:hypothetical protein